VFADARDVCLFCDVAMWAAKAFTAGWNQVKEGRIHSLRLLFDPRPLLAGKAA
jgi:hypothetical protein